MPQNAPLVVGKTYYEYLKKNNHSVFDQLILMQEGTEKLPKILIDVDQKLSAIQSRYPNDLLWKYVWADRSWVNCEYNEIKKRLLVCFEYFENLYKTEKPDLVLANAFASMPHLISYEVARANGIRILRPISLRLGNRYMLSDNATEAESWITDFLKDKTKKVSGETKRQVKVFLREFRETGVQPAYQKMRGKRT